MRRTLTNIVAPIIGLVIIAGCGTARPQDPLAGIDTVNAVTTVTEPPAVPEPAEVPTTVVAPTTTEPAPTTTLPDFSGVDFVALARDIHGQCGEYHDLAIQVGWPEEEWPMLSKVMWRESRCTTEAWNGADAGLTQINRVHAAWLADMGWSHPNDMFDAEKNLTFALRLWETSGWRPWRFSGPVPD